ncbi:hypothetical protein DNU06_17360 [Putridiphycobacter roseus]|uniref:Uncharacterized protein n=1 Tax=Putridiphycobacter roseus TaxID=2219161 RepID=A0A2W1MUU5_9FLAO|nr:hypothetical protein [Putridiphycobacter roseus]PZE15577.1 hypothetical protein DNU06_17360 [Putridiphycobacter roseus]
MSNFTTAFNQDNNSKIKSVLEKVSIFLDDSITDCFIAQKIEFNKFGDTTMLINYHSDYGRKPKIIVRKKYGKDNSQEFKEERYASNGFLLSQVKYTYDKNDSLVFSETIKQSSSKSAKKNRPTLFVTINRMKIKRDEKGVKVKSERYRKMPSDKASIYNTDYFYYPNGSLKKEITAEHHLQTGKKNDVKKFYYYNSEGKLGDFYVLRNGDTSLICNYNSYGSLIYRFDNCNKDVYQYNDNNNLLKNTRTSCYSGNNHSRMYRYNYVNSDSFRVETKYEVKVVKLKNGDFYSHIETQLKYDNNDQLVEEIYRKKNDMLEDSIYPIKWDMYHRKLVEYNKRGEVVRTIDSPNRNPREVQSFFDLNGTLVASKLYQNKILIRDEKYNNQGLLTNVTTFDKSKGDTISTTVIEYDLLKVLTYRTYVKDTLSRSITYHYNQFDKIIKKIDVSFDKNSTNTRSSITEYIYSYY